MPHSISNIKSQRRSEKKRLLNVSRRSRVKTCIKSFLQSVEASEKETAESRFRLVQKELDRAAQSGALYKTTAARKKSRLMKHLRKLDAQS